ncbi:thiol:disulfide interchange protein DsbE, putative [Paraglaciecola arctica BSs20135]|uniref:Thiol:disulfide interchange protein DsbE, putative n=2 Tax=Paraglaciecola TaxID=1621534 RepID=K6Z9N4_9ALTE|nr:thiol:disulfide interchange protein DsbE, putative [Paraglaciecola arctica BSs20135]
MTHWFSRKNEESAKIKDGFISAIIIGFIAARVTFVIRLWSEYQENMWQIFNLRDGGFIPYYGWMIGVLVLIVLSRGKRAFTRVYLSASFVTFCVVVPLHYTANYYSSDISIPEIPVRDSAGELINLQTFQGKPLVINYWATWCPPCRKEMPVMEAAQKQHSSVTFLFVNQGEDPMTAKRFFTSQDLEIKNVFYDPASQLSRASGAAGLPTTLFFDATGKLVDSHMGELSNASLAHYLQLLNKNDNPQKVNP